MHLVCNLDLAQTNPHMKINPYYDFRDDVKPGRDPDTYSKRLQAYHKELWSKPLPGGQNFGLTEAPRGTILIHESALGRFSLSSDSIPE